MFFMSKIIQKRFVVSAGQKKKQQKWLLIIYNVWTIEMKQIIYIIFE